MSVTAEQIRDVFRRYCELVSAGDVDAIASLYAADATVEDPVGSSPHRGRDATRSASSTARRRDRSASSSKDACVPPATRGRRR